MVLSLLLLSSVCAAPAEPVSFAVIIGNNNSPVLGRRSLQYADDDAVKYAEVFASFVAPEHLRLLTRADPDTTRLFGSTVALATPPTREGVARAMADFSAAMTQAHAEGRHAQAYFVFAGHGDVD